MAALKKSAQQRPAQTPLSESNCLLQWEPQNWPLAAGWSSVVEAFLASTAGLRLAAYIRERLAAGAVIYPSRPLRALELTALSDVKAVILGQDPYHGPGQAEGLAFSVREGIKLPPSLRNIFNELGCTWDKLSPNGSLVEWAKQGVLLLNATLTVEQGQPGSHANKGWEVLTSALLSAVAASASPCVYLLWGAQAQAQGRLIEEIAAQHGCEILLLQASHPSPLSARRLPTPFIGCGHFELARSWLKARGQPDVFQFSTIGKPHS